mmetsp:Transcript_36022/g.114782  ORF Transcript_36022/g.114782 Transcript_36022/m.114782 type:complete len:325 (+) Transcript_36022:294-1268(+)
MPPWLPTASRGPPTAPSAPTRPSCSQTYRRRSSAPTTAPSSTSTGRTARWRCPTLQGRPASRPPSSPPPSPSPPPPPSSASATAASPSARSCSGGPSPPSRPCCATSRRTRCPWRTPSRGWPIARYGPRTEHSSSTIPSSGLPTPSASSSPSPNWDSSPVLEPDRPTGPARHPAAGAGRWRAGWLRRRSRLRGRRPRRLWRPQRRRRMWCQRKPRRSSEPIAPKKESRCWPSGRQAVLGHGRQAILGRGRPRPMPFWVTAGAPFWGMAGRLFRGIWGGRPFCPGPCPLYTLKLRPCCLFSLHHLLCTHAHAHTHTQHHRGAYVA